MSLAIELCSGKFSLFLFFLLLLLLCAMFQNNQNSLKVHFDNQRKIHCSLELSDVNYLLKIVVFLEIA